LRFDGKNAYVSGGSSGIGLAAARLFASLGANVLIFSIDDQGILDEALALVRKSAVSGDQRFEAMRLDVTDNDRVQKEMKAVVSSFGSPYVLINSAGVGGAFYFEDVTYERFDKTVKANLYGVRNVTAALVPSMKPGGGYIVSVSSISGLIGVFGHTAYSSSKFAVNGFSEALRSEVRRHGISVSVLCPPAVDTPLWRKANASRPPENRAVSRNSGMMQPEEVAAAMLRGMIKGRFLIVPGRGRFIHLMNRLLPCLRERIAYRAVRKASENRDG